MPTFGERFKSLRLEKNMKQEELINDFNSKFHYSFTKSAVSQYENDKRIPEIQALNDFSEYFNVSVDYLLGRSEQKNNNIVKLFEPTNKQEMIRTSLLKTIFESNKKIDARTANKAIDIIEAFTKRGININDISLDTLDKVIKMYSIMNDTKKD